MSATSLKRRSRQLLVIAYAFPPCGGAGVQRTAKFVQYLQHFGWRPTVLTVMPPCYGVRDSSHINDLPEGMEMVRTAHFDPVEHASARSGTADFGRQESLGQLQNG